MMLYELVLKGVCEFLQVAENIIDQMMKFKDAWPFYDLVLKKDVSTLFMI